MTGFPLIVQRALDRKDPWHGFRYGVTIGSMPTIGVFVFAFYDDIALYTNGSVETGGEAATVGDIEMKTLLLPLFLCVSSLLRAVDGTFNVRLLRHLRKSIRIWVLNTKEERRKR